MAIPTKAFHGFCQSLQANNGILPPLLLVMQLDQYVTCLAS